MATTADDVWRLLGELADAQKETERRFQETKRRFQETERRFQESGRQFEETRRLITQQNQHLNEQLGKLGNRLGEFVEWQVRPAVVRLFQERGIDVHEFHEGVSVQRGDEGIEIDLLVVNTTDAVVVEVKSKLTQADVTEHLERLSKFKRLMPRYGDVRAMGAVAGMVVPDGVARYAYRQGLFVLAQSGNSVEILNDGSFTPRRW
ncbi:DUF3782 domain-containing protein [Phormidium sp. FACHB-1136]|uniref:DUF3782 domain-containing protein n=1 Tax=Phormidium sp. FACHB-1136 TaxID=2692848 RepID=UPI0016868B3C|nr:DUF3782 domain-containing protein [Phormidium sp. FACHB-1136]MBD2428701.1 DUF3782 domain-containing protein [Phormidium sp. FACHB-1136]